MNWRSLAEFTDMGGYALYVWGSYAMTAAALAWEGLTLVQRSRSAIDALRDREGQGQTMPHPSPRL